MVSVRSYTILLLCFATSLCAFEPSVTLNCLTDQVIEQCKQDFAQEQKVNKTRRTWTKAALYVVGTAAALGAGYWCFKAGGKEPAPVQGSLEALTKELAELKQQFGGHQFGSKAWFKSIALSMILNPASIISVLEGVGSIGWSVSTKLFYDMTVSWYIGNRTLLGSIADGSVVMRAMRNNLVPGVLVQELEYHAAVLDHVDKQPLVPVDYAYHAHRILLIFNKVIRDMAGLISYIEYRSDMWDSCSAAHLEATEQARYLFNVTNATGDALESALKDDGQDSTGKRCLMPIIKGFFAELEQVVVSFMRIEQEVAKKA